MGGCKQIEYELRVPRSGTYIMKPTASSEGAQLWDKHHPLLLLVPQSGTDYHPQHHTGCVYTLQPCHVPSSYVRQHSDDYYSDNLPCLLPLYAFVVIV